MSVNGLPRRRPAEDREPVDLGRSVLHHGLDTSSRWQGVVARISQQMLAEAVGTVREVIVPVLRDLRDAGLVGTGPNGIANLRPDALLSVGQPTATG